MLLFVLVSLAANDARDEDLTTSMQQALTAAVEDLRGISHLSAVEQLGLACVAALTGIGERLPRLDVVSDPALTDPAWGATHQLALELGRGSPPAPDELLERLLEERADHPMLLARDFDDEDLRDQVLRRSPERQREEMDLDADVYALAVSRPSDRRTDVARTMLWSLYEDLVARTTTMS
jgi:hypothetical protein